MQCIEGELAVEGCSLHFCPNLSWGQAQDTSAPAQPRHNGEPQEIGTIHARPSAQELCVTERVNGALVAHTCTLAAHTAASQHPTHPQMPKQR